MSLCMETREVHGGDVGADDVADAVTKLGADAVKDLGADAVKELGEDAVEELGADAVGELGADDVGADDVVSDESVVGVMVNIAAGCDGPVCVTGTETAGTATPAVFVSTRSGLSVPAGGVAGLLSASSGAGVGLVANLRGGVGGCETLTTAAKY